MEVSGHIHDPCKRPRYLLDRRLGGLQNRSGRSGKAINFHNCPCRDLNPGLPVHSPSLYSDWATAATSSQDADKSKKWSTLYPKTLQSKWLTKNYKQLLSSVSCPVDVVRKLQKTERLRCQIWNFHGDEDSHRSPVGCNAV
jgi:hypothetical protein